MATFITIVHILACIFLVLVVLLQTGKGADMGAVFGGSSATIFGSSGAGNLLTKLTTAMAAVFMLTSLGLTYLSSQRITATVFDSAPLPAAAPAPAGDPILPAPEAAAPAVEPQAAAEQAAPAPVEAPAAAEAPVAVAPAAEAPAAAPAEPAPN